MLKPFFLRIAMPHSVDAGAVRFLRPDGETERNALAVFEQEMAKLVAEAAAQAALGMMAAKDAEIARLRAALEEIAGMWRMREVTDAEELNRSVKIAMLALTKKE
jgi:hypothetical protein